MNNNLLINNFARLTQSPENVAELKKLVLQLAVQGKLTENWRAENKDLIKETGAELLEKIKAEKEELIKIGKLKRQKPLPEIEKDEKPFEIPDSWVWTRVGEINNSFLSGFAFKSSKYVSISNNQVIRLGNVKNNFILLHSKPVYISNDYAKTASNFELFENDFLITMTGTRQKKDYCFTCIVTKNDISKKKLFLNQRVGLFRFNNNLNLNLINIFYKTEEILDFIFKTATGSANQANIGTKALFEMPFPLPPLAEQKEIVSQVESLFEKIDQLHEKSKQKQALQQKTAQTLLKRINSQNANLQEDWQLLQNNFGTLINQKQAVKQLRQTILQLAVQGKLTENWRTENSSFEGSNDSFSGDVETGTQLLEKIKAEKEELIKQGKLKRQKPLPEITEEEKSFEIPDSWVWTRLAEISYKIHYGFNASAKPSVKDVRLLRITDIQNNKVNWESVPGCEYRQNDIDSYKLSENDILIARTGGTIGKSYLVKNISVVSLFASYLIRLIPSTKLFPEYMKLYIESPIYWHQLYGYAWGAGQPNVNGTNLSKLLVSLPPLAEQKAIVSQVEKLLKLCDSLEQKITESENLNKKLMQTIVKEYT